MTEYNFDEEMDLLAAKLPEFYEDAAARRIRLEYRVTWMGIRRKALMNVFGVDAVPKIATEEHIRMVKDKMLEIIEAYPDISEKTEPSE